MLPDYNKIRIKSEKWEEESFNHIKFQCSMALDEHLV